MPPIDFNEQLNLPSYGSSPMPDYASMPPWLVNYMMQGSQGGAQKPTFLDNPWNMFGAGLAGTAVQSLFSLLGGGYQRKMRKEAYGNVKEDRSTLKAEANKQVLDPYALDAAQGGIDQLVARGTADNLSDSLGLPSGLLAGALFTSGAERRGDRFTNAYMTNATQTAARRAEILRYLLGESSQRFNAFA